jgi:hypothetical protein
VSVRPDPVEPSPKVQEYEYGNLPPVGTALKVTGLLTMDVVGRLVKLEDNGSGIADVKMSLN